MRVQKINEERERKRERKKINGKLAERVRVWEKMKCDKEDASRI